MKLSAPWPVSNTPNPRTSRSRLYRRLDVDDVTAGGKSTRLTLKDADGAVLADIIVGKPKNDVTGTDRQGVYMRLPGDERAWLVEGSLDVRHDAAEWSDRMVVDIDARSLTALTVRHADGEIVALHRDRPQDLKLTLKSLPPRRQGRTPVSDRLHGRTAAGGQVQ